MNAKTALAVSDEAYAEQCEQNERRVNLFAEAMRGDGDFFDLDAYDAEQQYAVFAAVQMALQFPGSPSERWARFERALGLLVADYAQWRIDQ